MARSLLPLALAVAALAAPAAVHSSPWIEPSRGQETSTLPGHPVRFRSFGLRLDEVEKQLRTAPPESSGPRGGVEIVLPLPDGRTERLRVWETEVLSPDLRAAHPGLHTYRATGIDRREVSACLDVTALGLRALVFTPEGTAFLDPLVPGRTDALMSYWESDGSGGAFECQVESRGRNSAAPMRAGGSWGENLRTLRLALIGTGEYTQYLGGVTPALANMVTSVNRLNAIYERDLGIRFLIVGLTPFPDPNTDPYDGTPSLDVNQVVADSLYGVGSYDICQVMTQGGIAPSHGGVSAEPALCEPWNANSEVSAGDVTANDVMIKVMAHELGHTVGALHTGDSSCQFSDVSAVEPGSGNSIMGRAGKCGTLDVTPAPGDLFFNVVSIEQIVDTLAAFSSCGTTTSTGNSVPSANAGPDYTIPRGTPFVLVGSGSDPDPSDVLTYSWDESDYGVAFDDTVTGPLFRYRPPTTSPTRYLPAYATVLADTAARWEKLPSMDRLLHFKLCVRDNHPGAGAVAWDEKLITVSGAPFALTSPHGGESIPSGQFPVTWTVGGGSVASAVDIALSTDDGATWTALATNTPNDGAETVTYFTASTLPSCRVRVSAVGNIFYDVSGAPFTIQGGATDAGPTPLAFALRRLGANPSMGGASFELQLPRSGVVNLGVYSLSGRLLRTLARGSLPAGRHEFDWDGTARGRAVSAGVYFIRLAAEGQSRELRFVLVR